MMPPREAGDSVHRQADPTYGAYEGDRLSAHYPSEPFFEHPLSDGLGGKVYPERHENENKNRLRLMVYLFAMAMILLCAVLFIFFMGRIAGGVGFVGAAVVISALSFAAIEKIH